MAREKASASKGCRSSIRFANADRMNGQLEPLGDGDQDAAARRAVELGHDEAGDAGDLGEDFGLRHGILPGRRIEHQQHRMGRLLVLLLEDPDDLVKLGHEVRLVLQPPGRVDEENVGCRPPRPRSKASKARPAASAPVGREMTLAPMRSPQMVSCSIAAARNVSQAASITLKPSRDGDGRRACRWWWSCRNR